MPFVSVQYRLLVYHSKDLVDIYRTVCKLIWSADSKVQNYSRNLLNLIDWFVTFFAACTTQRGLNADSLAKIICFGSEAFQWLDSRATLRFLTLLLSASLAILSWMRHFGMHIGTSNEACPSCKLRTSMAWVALHSGKDGKASSRKRLEDKLFSRIMMSTSWPHCSAVLRRLICPLLVMTSRISAERWPRKEVLVFFRKSCMNNRNVCWNWTYDKDFELLFCTGIECSFSTRRCKRLLARHQYHNLSFRKQDTKCAKKDRKFDLENAEHLICTLQSLVDRGYLKDPRMIFNLDESGFKLGYGKSTVVGTIGRDSVPGYSKGMHSVQSSNIWWGSTISMKKIFEFTRWTPVLSLYFTNSWTIHW